jgi:hypothetical protein
MEYAEGNGTLIYRLPEADGNDEQLMTTDGSGQLYWSSKKYVKTFSNGAAPGDPNG